MKIPNVLFHGSNLYNAEPVAKDDGFTYASIDKEEALFYGVKSAIETFLNNPIILEMMDDKLHIHTTAQGVKAATNINLEDLVVVLYELDPLHPNNEWIRVDNPNHLTCWKTKQPVKEYLSKTLKRLGDIYPKRLWIITVSKHRL